MVRLRLISILTFLSFLFTHTPATGQETKRSGYPSAILVQLRAEQNRTNALLRAKKYHELEILRKDASGVMDATIRDFKDHLEFCPVYFFIDTNFASVIARKFEDVLLDSHLQPAGNIVISDTSTDYFIVYYGSPAWQTSKGNWDTTQAADVAGKPFGRGLIINDFKFRQINYLTRLDFDFLNFRKRHGKNPYKYTSKLFDMEYYPFAAELNRKFTRKRVYHKKKKDQ